MHCTGGDSITRTHNIMHDTSLDLIFEGTQRAAEERFQCMGRSIVDAHRDCVR
jgi:hypothetical protein